MAESTATLQAKLKALTHGKVDIMLDADTFKSTTQILREMSVAWEDMTDIERAAALELMGGKRQANILASVITNFETVEDVIKTSMNSSGSAMEENAKWLDSIEGKTYQFTNALEAMWNNMLNSDVIKGFLDFGTNAIQFLDTLPGKITAVIVALAGFAKFKGINFLNLGPDVLGRVQQYAKMTAQLSALRSKKLNLNLGSQADGWNTVGITAYANAVKGLTANEQAELLVKQGLNRAQIEEIMRRAGVEDKVIRETLSKKNLLNTTALLQAKTVEQVLTTDMAADATQRDAMAAFLAENGHKKLTKALLDEALARGAIKPEQYAQMIQNLSGSFSSMLRNFAKSPGIMMMAGMAIAGLIGKMKTAKEKTEELKEEYSELQSAMSEINGEIESLDSELETIQDRIDELNSKDKLSLTDAEELHRLEQQSDELLRQKKIQQQLLDAREAQEDAKSLQMINNMLKTTAAGQQKAAKDTASAWKTAFGIFGALAAGVAGFFTGGATWAALPTALGWAAAGGMVGGAIGEKHGYKYGLNSKESGDSLIEWYESYEKAIADAEAEAATAESKYMSNMTEKNHQKWQEKVEYVNTLQTEMYDGLTNLQDYISNLEYDDSTKHIIDGYNDLMTRISIKSNDGSIDAQINSIKSLRSEFDELSRGVDANGKNVALSAEEYARYCNIVDQILAYTPALIQGYDAEGRAILGAADAQYTYNQLLSKSIELLKEQKRQAAVDFLNKGGIDDVVSNAKETYDSDIENAENYDYILDNRVHQVADIIGEVIGVKQNSWDAFWDINEAEYVLENAEKIAENKDAIMAEIYKHFPDIQAEAYSDWLDGLIASARAAEEKANTEIKKGLYTAPLASEHYEDMSGQQLSFINSYINSLENLKDKTKGEVKDIADGIVGLVNLINDSPKLQNSIDDLMALDPSSMPVDTYRKKFEELWDEVENIIPEADRDAMYAYLFPDSDQIDTMIAEVQKKLVVSSGGLVKSLSLEELRIAYKIIPELSDNISFEELREEIQERLPQATGPIVKTYSTLVEQVGKFNEIAVQTSEIILDNTKVTQEYKDSLVELGISEEELAECFDATNGLIVTNAKELNKLVKSAKNNTAQNARLAKSQARLQYYELYKEMDRLVGANGEITEGNIDVVRSLYAEMNALEKTIAKYSMLEAQLLGNVNAFEKFQEAQEIDSATDYMGGAEDMVLALGEAFNTAELGSESAQAAILGLVPKSVYEDLDTVDEKMAAIYKYFRNGDLSKYFTLKYDDDGNIESAEMKLVNLKNFIEAGLTGDKNKDGINPFAGEDWQHFELNQTWLDSLPEGTDVLQALADQMNVTKEVAFAFVKSFKDHDIEWLDGDYSTFFDQMLAGNTEGQIQLYTERLADLTMQMAELEAEKQKILSDGTTTDEEAKRLEEINKKQEELNTSLDDYNTKLAEAKNLSKQNIFGLGEQDTKYEGKADYQIKTTSEIEATTDINELDNWIERNEKVKQLQEDQAEAQKAYQEALEEYAISEKTEEDLKNLTEAEKKWKNTTDAVRNAIAARDEFAKPTVLEIQVAIDEVKQKAQEAKKELDKKLAGGVVVTIEADGKQVEEEVATAEELLSTCFHMDEDGYWVIKPGVNTTELEKNYPEIFEYVNLLNSNTTLHAGLDTTEAETTLETLSKQIEEIIDLLTDIKVALSPESKTTFLQDCQNLLDSCGLVGKVLNIGVKFANGLYGKFGDPGADGAQNVNGTAHIRGTAHARGTAHKAGNWGLPASEHNSLVGELGAELVNTARNFV